MLVLIGEIAALVYGIVAVATGRLSLSAKKEARGVPARVAGVLLILPLPLALLTGVVIGTVMAAQGRPIGIGNVPIWIGLVELGIFLVFVIAAFVVAGVNAQPIEKRRPRRQPELDDDYADDDLRRPRPRGQDYGEPPHEPGDRYAR